MNMSQFKAGQGVHFIAAGREHYGVIMQTDDKYVDIVQVMPINRRDRRYICYNETGADYELHRDNVRLRDCFPPFNDLKGLSDVGIFAYANVQKMHRFSESRCLECDMTVVDDGARLTKDMMDELWVHEWCHHMEKEKSVKSCYNRIYGEKHEHIQGLDIDCMSDNVNELSL